MIYIRKISNLSDEHSQAMDILAQRLAEYGISFRTEDLTYNPWGKPMLKNDPVYFNISHSLHYAACAISETAQVGVDIEEVRVFSPIAARRVCSQEELDQIRESDEPDKMFFRLWTLKESYIKALGTGMGYPMKKANFALAEDGEIITGPGKCRFELLEDQEYIAAVCYLGEKGIKI